MTSSYSSAMSQKTPKKSRTKTVVVLGLACMSFIIWRPSMASAEPSNPMGDFIVKVICQRLGEGMDPAVMARQLVSDRIVGSEGDGRLLVKRAASASCPQNLGSF